MKCDLLSNQLRQLFFFIYSAENCLMKVVFCINLVYALLIKKTTIMGTKPNWMLPDSNNEQVLVIL